MAGKFVYLIDGRPCYGDTLYEAWLDSKSPKPFYQICKEIDEYKAKMITALKEK